MTWLVTGGAGYIGAHVVSAMREAGEQVVVFDDLSSGDPARIPGTPLVVGSLLDVAVLSETLQAYRIDGVVHIAAKKQVEESLQLPLYYYRENVEALRVLLEAATEAAVGSFIFSSSAAVYGAPALETVDEGTACRPVNPYGRTKLAGEWLVRDVAAATGMRYVNFRYFNVAGTVDPALTDRSASNLIPMVFQRLAEQRAPQIFGDDYDTPDGTCVRDFVHVGDIASSHLAAVQALTDSRVNALTANIGRGEGISVRDMVSTIREVTGTAGKPWAEPIIEPRRPGDPARVVASVERIRAVLGWQARYNAMDMIASAWAGWSAEALYPRGAAHE